MKKSILVLLIFGIHLSTNCQNLIVNSDFENVNICLKYKEKCSPKGWRSTNLKLFGYHNNEESGKSISLLLFNQSKENDRKFAQTELLCPLIKGQEYLITFEIKPDQFRIEELTIAFLDSMVFTKNINLSILSKNNLSFQLPNKINEGQWLVLQKKYIASGNEKVLIIGNFSVDALTKCIPINKRKYKRRLKNYYPKKRVQYGFDNIELHAKDSSSVCNDLESNRIRILNDSLRHILKRNTPKTIQKIRPDTIGNVVVKENKISIPLKTIPKKIILNNLEFQFNQWTISNSNTSKLDSIVDILKLDSSLKIKITGYTDSSGTSEYNLTLSLKRATSVKEYLKKKNINPIRLSTEGRGENDLISKENNQISKQKNRRVEIEFYR